MAERRWRCAAAGLVIAVCIGNVVAQAPDPRRSGFDDMSPALQALQRDDTQNPAWLWLKGGEQTFAADCARCHDGQQLKDVATRYPAFDRRLGKPLTLSGRINQCRQRHLQRPPLAAESDELLGLESWLGWLARGLPIAPPADPRLEAGRRAGERLYRTRFGQLDFSCAQCHDAYAGKRLAGSTIPQAHPTGYPIYRLEWQGMGSLQRRLRGCMSGVRAEPFAYGSDELTALELYLAQRAAGMMIETPAVRP
ncbi:sulfur oxidation c-type cytochrome SoxA [Piscinibacter sakaiensis]|uniref:sulfur oxidation c-type cytochrome SoxA n=1 Tax=Piscinibacter sakaiensis TaxID=1547922 RepID=UPI003AAA907F